MAPTSAETDVLTAADHVTTESDNFQNMTATDTPTTPPIINLTSQDVIELFLENYSFSDEG